MNERIFRNRTEAGRLLAEKLGHYANREDVLILALPRGGVPVAFEVARELKAPMDVFIVRKLGVPGYEELAMGAISSGGIRVLNQQVIQLLGISEETIERVSALEEKEIIRREQAYRSDRSPVDVEGRTLILIDDGIATGSTMQAAVETLRQKHPSRIVIAVPTAPLSCHIKFQNKVDEFITVVTPSIFYAIGQSYLDFSQNTDEEVRDLLKRAAEFHPSPTTASS